MSKNTKVYTKALHSLSDYYVENLENMPLEELKAEHVRLYSNSSKRIHEVKNLVRHSVAERKKKLFCEDNTKEPKVILDSILEQVKIKYGSLKNFIDEKTNSGADGFEDFTLAYRNRNENEIDEKELEGVLEDMIEVGQINQKDL